MTVGVAHMMHLPYHEGTSFCGPAVKRMARGRQVWVYYLQSSSLPEMQSSEITVVINTLQLSNLNTYLFQMSELENVSCDLSQMPFFIIAK